MENYYQKKNLVMTQHGEMSITAAQSLDVS